MKLKFSLFLCFSLLIIPSLAFSKTNERKEAIQQAFDGLRRKLPPQEINYSSAAVDYAEKSMPVKKSRSMFPRRQIIINQILDEVEIELGFKVGYIGGSTTYDFNYHTSELVWPLDNWMAGLDVRLGKKNLSLNAGFWGSITDEAGAKMTDKDWTAGTLASSSESRAMVDAIIWDANLRYDFYNKNMSRNINSLLLLTGDKVKIGFLLGYRYERYDFDCYDLYYPSPPYSSASMLYEDELVLTYNIKYQLPYIGLAADIERKKIGFKFGLKFPILPKAEHLDNHPLRTLTNPTRTLTSHGDYESFEKGIMYNVSGFWKFSENWRAELGVDGAYVKIDGNNWEDFGDPAWNQQMFTVLQYIIFWSGFQYKF